MTVNAIAPSHPLQPPERPAPTARTGAPAIERPKTVDGQMAGEDQHKLSMFAEEEPSFWDLLDVVNPLQHIPIVNNIYRELTGDKIGVGARMVGGALLGGPIGLIASVVNCVVEDSTGEDVGGHLLAMFKDDASDATRLASAEPEPGRDDASGSASARAPTNDAAIVAIPDLLGSDAPAAPAPAPVALAAAAPPPPPPPPSPPAAAPRPLIETQPAAAEGRPMPLLQREARFMPLPGRSVAGGIAAQSPPPMTVPVSNSGQRSNVPPTGARHPGGTVSPAMVQQMVAAQANTGRTPMAPAAGASATGAPTQDWFSGAMFNALDKYERGAKVGAKPTATTIAEP